MYVFPFPEGLTLRRYTYAAIRIDHMPNRKYWEADVKRVSMDRGSLNKMGYTHEHRKV